MLIRCIDCKSFSFKRVAMSEARQGLGHCLHRSAFIRHQAKLERDCAKFDTESDDTVQARAAWLKNNKETTA